MLSAILILLAMPFADLGRSRGLQFRPLSKIAFFIFIANFLILMVLGAKHVESPYIEFGQISTVLYFAHFLIIVPFFSILENSLVELELLVNGNRSSSNYSSHSNSVTLQASCFGTLGFNKITVRGFHTTCVAFAAKRELVAEAESKQEEIERLDELTAPLFTRQSSPNCSEQEARAIDNIIETTSHVRIRLEDELEAIEDRIETLDRANVDSEADLPDSTE
jgi:hypothetical protein